MNYPFPQHGSFALSRDDKVIVAHLSGTWNEETALAYESALTELAAPLTQEPWAIWFISTNGIYAPPT